MLRTQQNRKQLQEGDQGPFSRGNRCLSLCHLLCPQDTPTGEVFSKVCSFLYILFIFLPLLKKLLNILKLSVPSGPVSHPESPVHLCANHGQFSLHQKKIALGLVPAHCVLIQSV